jgi:hypothetical protein
MRHLLQATAIALVAATASAQSPQSSLGDSGNMNTPVVTTSAGRVIGRFTAGSFNGSVLLSNNNQSVLIGLILDTSFSNPGQPLSSGLTWGPRDVFFAAENCGGQAYVTTDPIPGGRRLAAPVRQEDGRWIAYVSGPNPSFSQPALLSHRSGAFGTCDTNNYSGIWVTPAQTTISLDNLGIPPFFVR